MKEMVPQVFNHKKEEQKTLTRAVGAFAKCKKGLKDGLKTTNGLVKKIKPATDAATQCQKDLTVAATAVTECTTSNKVFQNLANSECGAFQQFIKTEVATASSSCKLSSTADSFGLDAKRIVSYYSAVQTQWATLQTKCTNATTDLTTATAKCNTKQQTVSTLNVQCPQSALAADQAKCAAWRSGANTCQTLDTCFDQATQSFSQAVAAAKIQELGLKGEYEALLRLKCLTGVFTQNDTSKAESIKLCRTKDLSKTIQKMSLKYPNAPKKDNCTAPTQGCPWSVPDVSKLGAQITCTWSGDPHFDGFSRQHLDQTVSGKWWIVHNPYIWDPGRVLHGWARLSPGCCYPGCDLQGRHLWPIPRGSHPDPPGAREPHLLGREAHRLRQQLAVAVRG